MRTEEELLQVDLPKWPQCLIKGTKIAEEQALFLRYHPDETYFGYWLDENKTLCAQCALELADSSNYYEEDDESENDEDDDYDDYDEDDDDD